MSRKYLTQTLPLIVLTFMGCNAETATEQCENLFSDAGEREACLNGIQYIDAERIRSENEDGMMARKSALLSEATNDCQREYTTDSGLTKRLRAICLEAAKCYVEINPYGCELGRTRSP